MAITSDERDLVDTLRGAVIAFARILGDEGVDSLSPSEKEDLSAFAAHIVACQNAVLARSTVRDVGLRPLAVGEKV